MTDRDTEHRVRRMVDRVVSRRPRTKSENRVSILFVLSGVGLLIFAALQGQKFHGLDGMLLGVLFVTVSIAIALFVLWYWQRKSRKAALLNLVMPRDRVGDRRLNQQTYLLLAAEHRAIEEADFRRALAKEIKNIR
jgi:hypothetical protein